MSPFRRRRSLVSFSIGTALIAASFAVYPVYPVIFMLPLPVDARVLLALAAGALSWAIFLLGTTVAGPQGIEYLKRLITSGKAPPPPL